MNTVRSLIASHRSASPRTSALLGEGVVVVWNDVEASGRDFFYEWHDREHLPERLAIPGFLRGRRFRCTDHSPEWLTMYEAGSLDVLTSEAYMTRLNTPTPATTHALTYFRNTSRAVCRVGTALGTSTGGHMLALRFELLNAHGATDLKHYLCEQVIPMAMKQPHVLAANALYSDQASFLETVESSTRQFDVPSWVVLIEASTLEAAALARDVIDDAVLQKIGASLRPDAAAYSLEICRLPSPPNPQSGDFE